jgi:hypothetical protein
MRPINKKNLYTLCASHKYKAVIVLDRSDRQNALTFQANVLIRRKTQIQI